MNLKRFFVVRLLTLSMLVLTITSGVLAQQQPTGFVRTEKVDGVWWLISPEGEKFISLGVNHIEPHLWLAPYNKAKNLERYGSDFILPDGRFNPGGTAARKWIDNLRVICEDLHFNTFAKHTHPSIPATLYQDHIYYVASLETAPIGRWRQERGEGPRPDVFSQDFEHHLAQTVKAACMQHRNNRNLLGYLYADVPYWETYPSMRKTVSEKAMIYPWVNALLSLGEESEGKWKWIEILQKRYPSAEAAAEVWGMPISPAYGVSWDYLARLQTWFEPVDVERAQQDMELFMGMIAEQWYRLHHDYIRRYDPNHLILGDKSNIGSFRDWLVPTLKNYVDVVMIQSYATSKRDAEKAEWLYREIGKPIINGDGCFGFADPERQQLGIKGFRTGAKSTQEVAAMYQKYLQEIMATPYMIGWHHCGFMEQWDEAERGDVSTNENGFLDPFENYYTEWTDVIKTSNKAAIEWHLKAK
jgi:hypothetical protein